MAALSDSIEKFIKQLMQDSNILELKRNELAQYFACAPSQINYVLATRFSVDRGYITESHRGGGGYVKLIRVSSGQTDTLEALMQRIGGEIDYESVCRILARLAESKLITPREARIMRSGAACDGIPIGAKDAVRAVIFKNMLMQVFREED